MNDRLGNVLRHLWRLGEPAPTSAATDEQLLERFVARHEEEAFEALVQRHAPLVFGVCRRILRDGHDTEDAFQATFLLLARKAGSIRRRASVASWLYGVAYRVAVRARMKDSRRRARESRVAALQSVDAAVEAELRELRLVLDEELGRLPESYRAPLILCYLEGRTNEEAAGQLGWPLGTVKGRLARARELLRSRLQRRGLALTGGALTALLAREAVAAVPVGWSAAAARTMAWWALGQEAARPASAQAVALTEGVLRAMFVGKLRVLGVLLVTAILGAGLGVGALQGWGRQPGESTREVIAPLTIVPAPQELAAKVRAAPKDQAAAVQRAPTDRAVAVRFATVGKGRYGGPEEARQQVFTTPAQFAAAWKQYTRGAHPVAYPKVDFDTQMVVAVAQGTRPTGAAGIEITRVQQTPQGLVVHYQETAPAPDAIPMEADTNPYHVIRLERGGPVVFQAEPKPESQR